MSNGSTFVMPDADVVMTAEYDEGAIYNTEILFEVTVDSAHAGQPLTLIALAGDPLRTYKIAYGDGTEETKNFEAPVTIDVPSDNPDYQYTYNDNPLLEHTYAAEGVYTVSIQSGYNISASKFTTLWQDGAEWLLAPVTKPHITKLVKYLSNSIVNINYGFAGLTECVPDPGFKLEAPLVTTAIAAFHSFGRNASKGDPGAWTFRGDLLSELTELTDLNNMFRECRMREIPQGFFDSQTQVTQLYETFKRSWLGVGYYRQIGVSDFMNMNTAGESYLPMNLLHHMPNLTTLFATFNAMMITNRDFGWWAGGSYGDDDWNNGTRHCSLLIKADFFWNGKAEGNAAGTLQYIDYAFGKINQASFEKDVFRYIRNSLVTMSAVFYETSWPIRAYVGSFPLGWINQGWSLDPYPETKAAVEAWANRVSLNLQEILGTSPFPNVQLALNAFCAAAPEDRGDGFWPYGFNGNYGMSRATDNVTQDAISLDNIIIPLFPNITRTSGTWDGWSYQTGFDGMLRGLGLSFTNGNTGSVTPDADHSQAINTNPIQY
jgi:hypothetical protein